MKDLVLAKKLHLPTEAHSCVPAKHGIWELKGGGSRVFGYFLSEGVFIAVVGAFKKKDLKSNADYKPFIDKAKLHCDKHKMTPMEKEDVEKFI